MASACWTASSYFLIVKIERHHKCPTRPQAVACCLPPQSPATQAHVAVIQHRALAQALRPGFREGEGKALGAAPACRRRPAGGSGSWRHSCRAWARGRAPAHVPPPGGATVARVVMPCTTRSVFFSRSLRAVPGLMVAAAAPELARRCFRPGAFSFTPPMPGPGAGQV